MNIDYAKIKGREDMRKAKLTEKGGIIERMDKKAQASVYRISSVQIEDSINQFLASGGKIKKYG